MRRRRRKRGGRMIIDVSGFGRSRALINGKLISLIS